MGYGNYSIDAHAALTAGRAHQAGTEVFHQTQCHALMNPKGLKVRESRDSTDHPDALGIVFALDVTGSMGDIPHLLAKEELPNLMKLLTACGVADPQLMFMAIGDATSDQRRPASRAVRKHGGVDGPMAHLELPRRRRRWERSGKL